MVWVPMTRDPPTQFERELNERMSGGGCAEAWEAASDLNGQTGDEKPDDSSGHDAFARRTVLSSIGATAATTGFAGTAAGADAPRPLSDRRRMIKAWQELPGRYAELDVQELLASESTDVLDRLSAEEYIPTPSLAEFDEHSDTAVRAASFVENDVLMTVSWEQIRERPVAELFARIVTDDGVVRLSHSPSLDLAPVATVYEDGARAARITGDGRFHDFTEDGGPVRNTDCTLCYKTCDPFPEIRGENNWGTPCGGCDPGVDCGGGW